jgi:hypothetical protein
MKLKNLVLFRTKYFNKATKGKISSNKLLAPLNQKYVFNFKTESVD